MGVTGPEQQGRVEEVYHGDMACVDLRGAAGDILTQVSMLCQITGGSADGGVDRCLSSTAVFINHNKQDLPASSYQLHFFCLYLQGLGLI